MSHLYMWIRLLIYTFYNAFTALFLTFFSWNCFFWLLFYYFCVVYFFCNYYFSSDLMLLHLFFYYCSCWTFFLVCNRLTSSITCNTKAFFMVNTKCIEKGDGWIIIYRLFNQGMESFLLFVIRSISSSI